MDNNNLALGSESSEINLKSFMRKIWEKKWYFAVCAPLCLAIAYFYVKVTPPTYEVSTSLLIDVDARARALGSDPNNEKSISAIEAGKNLFNEIAKIKSFDLIANTLEELNFNISYHTKDGMKKREQYGYFPFEVVLDTSSSQMLDANFRVEILSADEYRIFVDESELFVQNPVTKSIREIEQSFEFSGTYAFGSPVLHDYFNFTLKKPSYKVGLAEFQDLELSFSIHAIESLAKDYLENLDVAQSDVQASILQMITRGGVVQKEVDFLETLTKNYIQSSLDSRKDKGSGRIAYLKKQLKNVKDSLDMAEKSLEDYRTKNRAINLSQTATIALEKIKNLETEKSQLELNNLYYSSVLESLQDTSGINKIVMPSTQGINDPVLNENLIELRKKYAERNDRALLSGNSSLDIEVLDNQVAELKRTAIENIQNLVRNSELTLTEKGRQLGRENSSLRRLPTNERNLVKYERESFRHSNMFTFLQQELTKTEIAFSNEMSDTQVIDSPRMQGDGPVAPQKTLIMLLGMLVGLFIPLGIIIVTNTVSEQISDIDQIERIAGIPVASSIGHFGMDRFGKIVDADKWKLEESFRDLSASLQFLLPNSQNNIIGVTSTIPGEGKTFCATNLGMNFAEGGKKILLIDTDLRNPSLIEDIERIKGKGLINYLKGEIEFFNEIIYEHEEIKNLHYIPTYPTDENPHKLLSSPRLRSLLTDLRDEYDYIIFDSPPVGLVSDYLLISKYFDIHLFVVRRKYSKLQYLHDVDKIKQRGKLKNMYIIFNDVKDDAFKYGYSNYEYRDSRKLKDIKKKIKK